MARPGNNHPLGPENVMSWLIFKSSSRTTKRGRRTPRLGSSFIALEDRVVPAVDLRASSFAAPLIVPANAPASVQFAVTNIGSTATTNSFSDRISLSDDAVVGNGDDLSLRTIGRSSPVSPGQTYSVP